MTSSPGSCFLFVVRICADQDCEVIELVVCFGLKADGVESFGEGGIGEVEILNESLVRVGVGEDEVDALRRVVVVELD